MASSASDAVEPRLVFCHNDLSPGNIIYDSITRNVAFLHLEYADINFQALEIARHFYTMAGTSDFSKVASAEFVPAKEFQMRWCQHYLAAYHDTSLQKVALNLLVKSLYPSRTHWALNDF